MAVAEFDPHGGPINVEVSCDPNRNGSYTIKLWEANANKVVEKHTGNFLNNDDDDYDLAGPNEDHEGRLLEAMVVVAIPPGVGPSKVSLVVSQDHTTLATDAGSVPPGSPGQLVDLFVDLKSK